MGLATAVRGTFVSQPRELFVTVALTREEEAWRVASRLDSRLFIYSPP